MRHQRKRYFAPDRARNWIDYNCWALSLLSEEKKCYIKGTKKIYKQKRKRKITRQANKYWQAPAGGILRTNEKAEKKKKKKDISDDHIDRKEETPAQHPASYTVYIIRDFPFGCSRPLPAISELGLAPVPTILYNINRCILYIICNL